MNLIDESKTAKEAWMTRPVLKDLSSTTAAALSWDAALIWAQEQFGIGQELAQLKESNIRLRGSLEKLGDSLHELKQDIGFALDNYV